MEKRDLLYEGKAKKVFQTDDSALLIVSYKDDATAFNGIKKGSIIGKGTINNRMTNIVFSYLQKNSVLEFSYKNDVLGDPMIDDSIILADEVSSDTCHLWDKTTNEKLDKDRFRRDLGGVEEAYQEVFKKITKEQQCNRPTVGCVHKEEIEI